jgi:hemoglobin-like flavoprotein
MATDTQVPLETVQIAEDSYRRCGQEAFFEVFYGKLLAADPTVRAKFAHTDFARQYKALQHGLGLLMIFAKRKNPVLLERIAGRHGSADLDISPSLYPLFLDSLVATVKEFDPQFSPQIEDAWRRAVAPGVEFMSAHHTPATGQAH